MKFSKNVLSKSWKFWALENGALLPFVQSGNVDISSLTGFEPRTLCITVGSLIPCTKFPYRKILKKFSAKFSEIFTIFLWQSRQSNRATIGDFFRKDKKQESLEQRQHENVSIQSKQIPILKLPLFFLTKQMVKKALQFQNWNLFWLNGVVLILSLL